jgi:hypothetical protein
MLIKMKAASLIFFLFIFGLGANVKAQTNLVPDSSFEDNYTCNGTTIFLEDFLSNWRGGLGYFNPCLNTNYNVPSNIVGYQFPRTGDAYCGIYTFGRNSYPIRQYIQAPLLATLEPSKKYLVSFFVSLGDSLHAFNNSIGVYFSEDSITYLNELLNFEPQIKNDTNNQLNDMLNWVKVSDTLIAMGNEKWITIGNFLNDTLSQISPIDSVCSQPNSFGCGAYYFIDDVSVTLIDDTGLEESAIPPLHFYPNPSKAILTIVNPGRRIKRFQVLSVSGAVLMRQEKVETNTVSVDLSSLAPGLYFLQAEDGDGGVRIGNFVKE